MFVRSIFNKDFLLSFSSPASAFRASVGGVLAVLIQMDEQLADARDPAALHHPTVGHIPGRCIASFHAAQEWT